MAKSRMIYMAMPKRATIQAAIGRVAVRHGQMDHVLRMTIKSICEVSPQEARRATAGVMSGKLRERVEHLARKRFGDCPALLRLQALLKQCRQASEERNRLLHGVFAQELDGPELFMGDGEPGPMPTLRELNALAAEMDVVTKELNDARFGGFLSDAIKQSKPIKAGA
jgi:hypothetical protein